MNKLFSSISLSVSKINKTHVQILIMLAMLAMLVLGAGAPESLGGVAH
jgi:hypothetical protein